MPKTNSRIQGFTDTIAWYEQNAHRYAQSIQDKFNLSLITEFVAAVKQSGVGVKVLDAGCAAGRDTVLLYEYGLEVVGIDVTHNLLEIARSNFPNLSFVEGNFLDLPFENRTFAGIWANASLLHLETIAEVRQALSEFHRVLKPGGILHVFVKEGDGVIETSVVTDTLSQHERFFRWFTSDELAELLAEQGFQVDVLRTKVPDTAARSEVKWIHVLSHV